MLVVPSGTDMTAFHSFKYGNASMPDNYPKLLKESEAGAHIRANRPVLYGNVHKGSREILILGMGANAPDSPGAGNGPVDTLVTGELAKVLGIGPDGAYALNGVGLRAERVLEPVQDLPPLAAVMPLEAAQRVLGKRGLINALYLGGCWCSTDIAALGRQVEAALPGTRAISVAGTIEAQKGAVDVMRRYSAALYLAAVLAAAGIILVIVMGQIKRHSREMGIFAALGTPMESVYAHQFIKALIIALAGGAAGCLIGLPAAHIIGEKIIGTAVDAGAGELLPALGVSLAAGLLGALIPAYRITRLDPAVILREV